MLELRWVSQELEEARVRHRRTEVRRLRRDQGRVRMQFLTLEHRLEELASRNGHGQDLATSIKAALRREKDNK